MTTKTQNRINKATNKYLEKIMAGSLTFGRMLSAIRECEEINQTEFAKMLGISRQQLCDLEHDRRNISPALAINYAEKLGYSKTQFARLALQNIIDKGNLNYQVKLTPKLAYVNR